MNSEVFCYFTNHQFQIKGWSSSGAVRWRHVPRPHLLAISLLGGLDMSVVVARCSLRIETRRLVSTGLTRDSTTRWTFESKYRAAANFSLLLHPYDTVSREASRTVRAGFHNSQAASSREPTLSRL